MKITKEKYDKINDDIKNFNFNNLNESYDNTNLDTDTKELLEKKEYSDLDNIVNRSVTIIESKDTDRILNELCKLKYIVYLIEENILNPNKGVNVKYIKDRNHYNDLRLECIDTICKYNVDILNDQFENTVFKKEIIDNQNSYNKSLENIMKYLKI